MKLKILSKLVPKKDIEEVYVELISVENFKNLRMNWLNQKKEDLRHIRSNISSNSFKMITL